MQKSVTTVPPVERFLPKIEALIYVRIILNIKFHEILCITSRVTLAAKFLSHTHSQTDIGQINRQTFFRNTEIVFKTSQRHVNPSKTGNRKFLRSQCFFFIYIQESKNVSSEPL